MLDNFKEVSWPDTGIETKVGLIKEIGSANPLENLGEKITLHKNFEFEYSYTDHDVKLNYQGKTSDVLLPNEAGYGTLSGMYSLKFGDKVFSEASSLILPPPPTVAIKDIAVEAIPHKVETEQSSTEKDEHCLSSTSDSINQCSQKIENTPEKACDGSANINENMYLAKANRGFKTHHELNLEECEKIKNKMTKGCALLQK